MARSFSNVGTDLALEVSVVPPFLDGEVPSLSITAPTFYSGENVIFGGRDQQLVSLEVLLREYAEIPSKLSDKFVVAAFLERMARVMREAAAAEEAGDELP
jgi:hypothetical protein